MDDLAKRIEASLENVSGEPWFPELTARLACRGWDNLQRDLGLTPETYGTERVLSCRRSAHREFVTSVAKHPPYVIASTISIEALTPECAVQYTDGGIAFYTSDEILHSTVLSCIEDAFSIIKQVPSLMRTVAMLVRSFHLLKQEHEDQDISFSEPEVPFSIFISVPRLRRVNDALRVAEAITHESMHLQLTLLEQVVPLVRITGKEYFSPWRGEYRTAQGVLHALYVFKAIDCFLAKLMLNPSAATGFLDYVEQRRCEINTQIKQVGTFGRCPALTTSGATLVGEILASTLDCSRNRQPWN